MPKPSARTSNDRSTAKNSAIEQAALGTTAAAMALGILASDTDLARATPNQRGEQRHETVNEAHTAAPAAVAEATSAPDTSSAAHVATPAAHEPALAPAVATPEPIDFGAQHHAGSASSAAAEPVHSDLAPVEAAPMTIPVEASSLSSAEPVQATVSGPAGGSFSPAVDASAFQIDMPGLNSSVSDLGANITSMVNATLDAALSVPTMAVGHLVDAVFQATPLAADTPLIDATPLVSGLSLPAPLTLGFMGQPQQEGEAVHDGAFSALGLHHV